MKTKIFIVTYNRPDYLQQNLVSLYKQLPENTEIIVINNHTEFKVDFPVKVMHNTMRPDFSTGHLARNWNQAIIHGFCDLDNPECDLVITCQDDTIWLDGAFDKIYELVKHYDFVTDGIGDNLCIYRPQAVKEIGLWDERFCNIGYQEADYFLRAVIAHPTKSSINDYGHGRVYNPMGMKIIQHPRPGVHDESHQRSMEHHSYTKTLFEKKWGIPPEHWKWPLPNKAKIPDYMYYPYFEKKINKQY